MRFFFTLLTCLVSFGAVSAQNFTHEDSLRGAITTERAWWDVEHYDLHVRFDIANKQISGKNVISYAVTAANQSVMQLDLMVPMSLDSVLQDGRRLQIRDDGNAHFVTLPKAQQVGDKAKVVAFFHGSPMPAVRPPWDGGIIWTKDSLGRDWVSVACQGLGASVWYPNKDQQADEPNAATMHYTVPAGLTAVGNGRLIATSEVINGEQTFTWAVTAPINNYNIVPYIGHYENYAMKFSGANHAEGKELTANLWFLDYHLARAEQKFMPEVTRMLAAFEYWFGPYPFFEDGYQLVEAPHLGMEHQSATAYGNDFMNGYKGRDLSNSGWGMKWDFILVHESGHEWFANNITTKDLADMWVHEGFTNYSETLYTDYHFGEKAGNEYCIGTRMLIQNDKPIIAAYGVNAQGSGDMYYKGGNLVHIVRQLFDNDEKFRTMLQGLNTDYKHKTVTSAEVEAYISNKLARDLGHVFDQYLRSTKVPVLEYQQSGRGIKFRWTNCVEGFDMPMRIFIGDAKRPQWIYPVANRWQTWPFDEATTATFDPNFYINLQEVK